MATPCPVQTRRRLCRKPHRQAWLATGTRCAWHPTEGEGRSTAGPGRLQHLSHSAKGPSGGATNSRTGPARNANEDRGPHSSRLHLGTTSQVFKSTRARSARGDVNMQIWKHMCATVPAHNQAGRRTDNGRYSNFCFAVEESWQRGCRFCSDANS